MADHLHLDGKALRVLAHPLRARLLAALRVDGAATATTLAEKLATNTGATSYHLRKLAEVGLVEETGEGTGKQRYWAAAQHTHGWSEADFADDPDALAASAWLQRRNAAHFAGLMAAWEDERPLWPLEWRVAARSSDDLLTVDADRLDELMSELEAVLTRHRQRPPSPGGRRVTVLLTAMPTEPADRP